jgi:hypothetical protein
MDEKFKAKKLGEVLAFARVGAETLEKGKEGFVPTFGEEYEQIVQQNLQTIEVIESINLGDELNQVLTEKAEATGQKLRKMRDVYISNEEDWSNTAELLEWSGFFEGAAFVHWNLIKGLFQGSDDETAISLADEEASFHQAMLERASKELYNIGTGKAGR